MLPNPVAEKYLSFWADRKSVAECEMRVVTNSRHGITQYCHSPVSYLTSYNEVSEIEGLKNNG